MLYSYIHYAIADMLDPFWAPYVSASINPLTQQVHVLIKISVNNKAIVHINAEQVPFSLLQHTQKKKKTQRLQFIQEIHIKWKSLS